MTGPFILACVVLAWGFFLAGRAWESIRSASGYRVLIVRAKRDGHEHEVAVGIKDKANWATWEYIDLRKDGYEERLAEAVAEMKHKRRAIEAARQIASER